MLAQVHFPEKLTGQELDEYLEQGWFRMGQSIFTTNFLNFKSEFYSAIWLRVGLEGFKEDSTFIKLRKRNSNFWIEVKEASVSSEVEALYKIYKQSISFQTSHSVKDLLYRNTSNNIYNTYQINIYHEKKLIASGFFDIGKNSAAGITSFYDPSYKKYSLGKYLIYLKMNYCRDLGLRFFYPGYFAPGYPFFDYKLTIGRPTLEYLQLRSQDWKPIDLFSSNDIPLQVMREKLQVLQNLLTQSNILTSLFHYEYFDANLIPELAGAELFDFPVFLYCSSVEYEGMSPLIIFDVRDGEYYLVKCISVWKSESSEVASTLYSLHLLKIEKYLIVASSAEELASTFFYPLISGEGKSQV